MILDSILTDYPILLPYGCACLLAHIVLYVLFRYVFPPGPWRVAPSFTAHQAVAFVLMVQWTVQGFQNLSATEDQLDPSSTGGPQQQLLHLNSHTLYNQYKVLRPVPAGLEMAQRSMGALWIWDIPVAVLSSDMAGFDGLMHAHHVGMLLITCIVLGFLSFGDDGDGGHSGHGWPVASCYAPVFLGVIELSSIPLQLVDLFHPKKGPDWHSYMGTSPFLSAINEIARISFALLFLVVRGGYFPYVIVTTVLPDCYTAIRQLYPMPICLPITIILIFAVAFTVLQLHWAMLILKQIAKTLGGGGGDSSGDDDSSSANHNDQQQQQRTTDNLKKDE